MCVWLGVEGEGIRVLKENLGIPTKAVSYAH